MRNIKLNVLECYNDPPKKVFKLESAFRIESKTRQFPFVVAHEVSGSPNSSRSNSGHRDIKLSGDELLKNILNSSEEELNGEKSNEFEATREFLVFHDIEHFLNQRLKFPHCHEVIRCPSRVDYSGEFEKKIYFDDKACGRLIFDFDLEEPLPGYEDLVSSANLDDELDTPSEYYVPANFVEIIEDLINTVFIRYFKSVDIKKLLFVWQRSTSPYKFSRHLIVKHAYFSEYWVKQMRVFYLLFKKVALERKLDNILKSVDFQIARRNATFRIMGSSKIGGTPLEIVCCNNQGKDLIENMEPVTIYDCLVGIYSVDVLRAEQMITLDMIDYTKLREDIQMSENKTPQDVISKQLRKQLTFLEEDKNNLDIDDKQIDAAVDLFAQFNDGSFKIRDQVGNILNLDRTRKSPCPISGAMHERENAYLRLQDDGNVYFYCRRGCKKNNSYGLSIGFYRQQTQGRGLMPLNLEMIEHVRNASVTIKSTKGKKSSNEIKYIKDNKYASKVKVVSRKVVIPSELRTDNKIIYKVY